MALSKELKGVLSAHYITNILLAVTFFLFKTVSPICGYLFENCHFEMKEWELITFLGCVIVLKNRRQALFTEYISTACMFGKVLQLYLFFKHEPLYAIIYAGVCLAHLTLLPAPVYSGPNTVVYFRGNNLDEELSSDRRNTWLVTFYAAWSPSCVNFAPIFAELSSQYCLENFKFGKVDVTRFPHVAEKYKINASTWSKQLPTVSLFQDGKEVMRRPFVDSNNKVAKYVFHIDNVIQDFELKNVYAECKKGLAKRKLEKQKNKTE